MAIVTAVASGDYSNYAVTFGGIVPQPGDTVRCSNFIINLNISVSEIRFENGPSINGFFRVRQTEISGAGGSLIFTNCDFVSLTAQTVLQCSHETGTVTIRDGISLAPSNTWSVITHTGFGTLNGRDLRPNAGTGIQQYGLTNSGNGTVNFENAYGGWTESVGLRNTGAGTANITNAYGGPIGVGVWNTGSGTVNVVNAYSSLAPGLALTGVLNSGSGTANITNGLPGDFGTQPAASNTGTGFMYMENAYGNNFGPGGTNNQAFALTGGNGTPATRTFVRKLFCGRYGAFPVSGSVLLNPSIDNVFQFRLAPNGATKTLIDSSVNNAVPAQADVRFGTIYQNGDRTGTLRVPTAGQVVSGVLVDNTVGTAILDAQSLLSVLQPNPAFILERSLDDDKPLTFSWPNSTDTITGEVSIDNAPYVPLQGTISFLRTEGTKHYFTISYDKDDRPGEEGTARYKLTSGARTIYATLRVVQPNIAGFGPYKLNCNVSCDNVGVQGVMLSIVGKSAKTITDEDGNGSINVDGGKSYIIRVTPPAGYQDIADITVNVAQSNYQLNITLEKLLIPDLGPELCVLQVFIKSQGTVDVGPISGVNLTANLNDCYIVDNDILHLNTVQSAVTNEAGYAELILLRGQSYNLEISSPVSYYQKVIPITIPNESSATLSQVIE